MTHLFRHVEIDVVDLEQREIALPVLRRANLSFDRIAGAQAEPTHLAWRDVDVVGAGQVVGFRGPQKAETILKNLEHAVAEDRHVVLRQLLKDRKHHVLLAQGTGVFDLQFLGERQQFCRGLALQFLEIHREPAREPSGVAIGATGAGRGPDMRSARAASRLNNDVG